MNCVKIKDLFDLRETIASQYLSGFEYPWEALAGISDYIKRLGPTLSKEEYEQISEDIWVAKDAQIASTASLNGPLIVDKGAQIRHCAFVRGSAIIGQDAVVGNSTELKNVILFNGVQVPHYNYVGDSILGYKAHMGAGAVTSNVKADKSNIVIKSVGHDFATGRKKVGAMLGDYAEVGCNSVLNPGTVIGRNTNIYPLSCVRGVVPENSIYKNKGEIVSKKI